MYFGLILSCVKSSGFNDYIIRQELVVGLWGRKEWRYFYFIGNVGSLSSLGFLYNSYQNGGKLT